MSPGDAIAVIGGCGGAGGSLTAVGLAVALERAGRNVLLLDLDPERGDLAGGLGSLSPRTIEDLVAVAGELTADHLRAASVTHPSGLALVPGSLGAASAPSLAVLVGALLELPGRPPLVIDAGSGATPVARALTGRCTLLMVAPCDAAGCRVARRTAAVLSPSEASVVVNRGSRAEELSPRVVARAMGMDLRGTLPRSPGEAADLGAGVPREGRRARLGMAFSEIAAGVLEGWCA